MDRSAHERRPTTVSGDEGGKSEEEEARSMLDVYDDVERALEAADDGATTRDPSEVCRSLQEGIELLR